LLAVFVAAVQLPLVVTSRPARPRRIRKPYDNRIARDETSKIGRDQIIRTPASANIEPGCGCADQITVGIKRFQKARLIGAGVWLNAPQCILVYEK
jgi:hypothetical protein